jgi:iron(III) transport system ATP-binding protein
MTVDPVLRTDGLTVTYGDVVGVAGVDLVVDAGEALAVLGPSGSGKTTLLHAVAGFLGPTAGTIDLAGRRVAGPGTDVPPERRDVGMVFQHHALWPHLDVAATVAYPLQRRSLRRAEIDTEVGRILDRLGIAHLATRRPDELSGGERQRVSLARALARHPILFLFDEPTVYLDASLRLLLLDEIDRQRRKDGTAAVYATHESAEALSIADRVALLRAGALVQVGTPIEVYERPVDLWAARLTGPASVLDAAVVPAAGGTSRGAIGGVEREVAWAGHEGGAPLIRPEWASLGGPLPGTVEHVWFRGPITEYRLETPAGEIIVRHDGPPRAARGDAVGWDLERVWLVGS